MRARPRYHLFDDVRVGRHAQFAIGVVTEPQREVSAALEPEVMIITGDHSTPAALKEHSWHHVPALLASPWSRPTGREFGESACRAGDLGVIHATDLLSLALAHTGRLVKYGA